VSDLGPRTTQLQRQPGPLTALEIANQFPTAGHLARRPAAARARQDPRVPTPPSADAAKRCFFGAYSEGPTTVPAAAFASVALVEGRYDEAASSALQLLVNLIGIVVAAIAGLLVGMGFRRRRGVDRPLAEG
jgi:hypothetical protein